MSSKQKETSSTSGMRETVQTSDLIKHRAEVHLIAFFVLFCNYNTSYGTLSFFSEDPIA